MGKNYVDCKFVKVIKLNFIFNFNAIVLGQEEAEAAVAQRRRRRGGGAEIEEELATL